MRFLFNFVILVALGAAGMAAPSLSPSVNRLHADLWNRFVYPPGILLDYVAIDGTVQSLTSEDFKEARPNALAWWSPKENGPFFTGLYLDGMLDRWRLTQAEEDLVRVRTLVQGLLRCASVGQAPGFIARGIGDDGVSHHALGSDDQTGPWFYGLWRFIRSGAATRAEKIQLTEKMREVAEAIRRKDWLLPVDAVGSMKPTEVRGGFRGMEYRGATRLLFISRIMFELTGETHWRETYGQRLHEKAKSGKSRLEIVTEGMPGEVAEFPDRGINQLWIFVVSQAMVRELVTLESDAETKSAYLESLRSTAKMALPKITDRAPTDLGKAHFATDWQRLNERWKPQRTVAEAVAVARHQIQIWSSPGRELETKELREPFCAAWLVLLAPNAADGETETALQKFDRLIEAVAWQQMHSSYGFFGEAAAYLRQVAKLPSTAKK